MSRFFISYLRLSKKQTPKPGESEAAYYGLDAQRKTIADEIARQGGTILKEYIEIESAGRKNIRNRTEILKAIRHCKDTGATLIVSKLDRLSRDTAFLLSVINSGIEILFCDFQFNGIAGRMMLTIISSFAEYELARISQRTKEGLAVAKSRGKKLGGFSSAQQSEGVKASLKARKDNYHETPNFKIKSRVQLMMQRDKQTPEEICEVLNNEGIRSTRNKQFTPRLLWSITRKQKQTI